ncbi:DUF5988 family protein [Pseudonocardia endophytica]|uniref:Uncharacterized protein n=1 Tax=Pseudonocardia endophytica TaxID=401976 RepID=A0A4V6NDF5_PSEEN|nr:DUF5988 family protein [Pseudonocardia endophytica]TCK22286.1 hypothetical protein EV378_6287 [Pseudonocardia endophytica]
MERTIDSGTDVVLEGGPAGATLADALVAALPTGPDRLKIPHRGGYEHFERHDDAAQGPVVYRWVTRTTIAE